LIVATCAGFCRAKPGRRRSTRPLPAQAAATPVSTSQTAEDIHLSAVGVRLDLSPIEVLKELVVGEIEVTIEVLEELCTMLSGFSGNLGLPIRECLEAFPHLAGRTARRSAGALLRQ
jgi:hypothetical protein